MPVLIIADDRSVRSMMATLLEREGFDITAVEHGDLAVEAVGEGDFAAIVLQVNVTRSRIDDRRPTGIALLRHMDKTKPHLIARTVVVTTMPRVEVTAYAKRIQPFDVDELLAAVRGCLQGT